MQECSIPVAKRQVDSQGFWYYTPNYEVEKLSKLIVQACLEQCYNRGMNDEPYEGQLKAAAYIEEYFGVE